MKRKLAIVILILLIAIIASSCFKDDGRETITPANDETMTLEEFNELSTDMSYEDVINIIGSEGTVISEIEMSGYKTTIYQWTGDGDIGANANVTFQNDKLISKAQYGLK